MNGYTAISIEAGHSRSHNSLPGLVLQARINHA